MNRRNALKAIISMMMLVVLSSCLAGNRPYTGYLFVYFTGNGPGEEQVRYAISTDGASFYALNSNKPVLDSKIISTSGGVRDPHLLRGEDGSFYMVLTDLYVPEMGWQNTAMVMLKSTDLINWTHTVVDIPQTFPKKFGDVFRVWAPQTIYDPAKKKYMLYWSMLQPEGRDIIYYAYANEDFTGLATTPKQLLFKEGACIDGDIVYKDGQYHLFFKNEDEGAKGILKAVSDKINKGYVVGTEYVDQTDDAVEGSGTFPLIDGDNYILMYDMYTSGKYQFCETNDLENFKVIDEDIRMNFHPRHGSVIPITQEEMDRLLRKYGEISGLIYGFNNPEVRKNNTEYSDSTIRISVLPGTDLSTFKPAFDAFEGIEIQPKTAGSFANGSVTYTVDLGGITKDIEVEVVVEGNPVLNGYYADPEIIYSEKNHKYYLYPTSDGFHGWSGKYFEVFESEDLISWENKGIILDLTEDVSWADRNAWAPCATEKKINGKYQYFYYFTAAQKIGVAVADDPAGPFTDSGKALIDFRPEGAPWGQEIDPDVFTDPQTGKSYLYWGNGYMAVAELNDDMMSIDRSTVKLITPDNTFREGTEVFFRNGKYYFLWSEDDTRSPNYRVRYATADSPLGPLHIPTENLVIEKDTTQGIYGTGHNSVVYNQQDDQWYIVYHRFNKPKGIKMGGAAGFHREVCIDPLNFDEEGNIIKVKPTLSGLLVD